MRPSAMDIFHATQRYQACFLLARSMEWATPLGTKEWR